MVGHGARPGGLSGHPATAPFPCASWSPSWRPRSHPSRGDEAAGLPSSARAAQRGLHLTPPGRSRTAGELWGRRRLGPATTGTGAAGPRHERVAGGRRGGLVLLLLLLSTSLWRGLGTRAGHSPARSGGGPGRGAGRALPAGGAAAARGAVPREPEPVLSPRRCGRGVALRAVTSHAPRGT